MIPGNVSEFVETYISCVFNPYQSQEPRGNVGILSVMTKVKDEPMIVKLKAIVQFSIKQGNQSWLTLFVHFVFCLSFPNKVYLANE